MQSKIIEAIAEYLSVSTQDVDRHASLRDDLGLSPIELNDLFAHLSAKFNVHYDPEDAANIQTVDDLLSLTEDESL